MEGDPKTQMAKVVWLTHFNQILSQAEVISETEKKRMAALIKHMASASDGYSHQKSPQKPPA